METKDKHIEFLHQASFPCVLGDGDGWASKDYSEKHHWGTQMAFSAGNSSTAQLPAANYCLYMPLWSTNLYKTLQKYVEELL